MLTPETSLNTPATYSDVGCYRTSYIVIGPTALNLCACCYVRSKLRVVGIFIETISIPEKN